MLTLVLHIKTEDQNGRATMPYLLSESTTLGITPSGVARHNAQSDVILQIQGKTLTIVANPDHPTPYIPTLERHGRTRRITSEKPLMLLLHDTIHLSGSSFYIERITLHSDPELSSSQPAATSTKTIAVALMLSFALCTGCQNKEVTVSSSPGAIAPSTEICQKETNASSMRDCCMVITDIVEQTLCCETLKRLFPNATCSPAPGVELPPEPEVVVNPLAGDVAKVPVFCEDKTDADERRDCCMAIENVDGRWLCCRDLKTLHPNHACPQNTEQDEP